MNIQTKYFGALTIAEADLIKFPNGLPGFPDEKNFALINIPDNPTFLVLQSITEENIAFIVMPPLELYQDYEVKLDDSTLELLEIESEQDVSLLGIITLKEKFSKSTINLQAPIVINHRKRLAKQYITNHKAYSTQTPLTPVQEQEV
ncbi:flagellar assembly protein FliW [Amphibacillus sp. MSJ-3]|uniref:flagellar assembly protein FliW n=1 Tax=Amphibacillus sp. MSJ-3 TaxID=2841505 RepID=UPI001C0EF288|nr:flagellar assembly protein FliW [Amphibacillus sp. MSJ-3]MBU5594111.1 flagellar assembly protein FliW [Amphibacillus sp. MSJ-3]